MTNLIKRCSDVTWEMGPKNATLTTLQIRSRWPLPPGTLIWQPKGGEGHVVVEGEEERNYGMGMTPLKFPICQCGQLDFEDHHWVILRRGLMSKKHQRKTNRAVGVSKKQIRKQKTKERVVLKKEENGKE